MFLGPVFQAELLTTARRARYYVVRTIYGLIILFQVYLSYESNRWVVGGGQGNLQINQMAEFGESIFKSFAILQAVVVIFLTPALVGGTIADERQRKTLHYLLTSHLSGFEIVVGKLAARLLHVGVLVALGLPVVSLIGLFGGVDFPLLLLSYAGTATMIYFLAGLSILVSVHARRPREAISALYGYVLIWLIVPPLLISTMTLWSEPWRTIGEWIRPALEYLAVTSPLFLGMGPSSVTAWGGSPEASAAWGMGLQLLYGTIFISIAAARLRSVSRDDGARRGLSGRIASFARKQSWMPRPDCGDDAMLWKERYIARTGGMTKTVLSIVGLALLGLLAYWVVEFARPAWTELMSQGYSTLGSARRDFNIFLRFVSTAIFVVWSLAIAASSASGLTSEREEDTWISLIATPLSGLEILRAKMIGPIWALRGLVYLLLGLWAVGLLVGSIHPLGILACLAELILFTWFLTALGTASSLQSKNSTRSMGLTMFILVFLNGGYLFCCIPLRADSGVVIAGSTPAIFWSSLISSEDLQYFSSSDYRGLLAGSILGSIFYAVTAAALTAWAFERFDSVVDRPDRFRRELSLGQREEMLKGRSKEPDPRDLLI
ncbi:ABC transporter permease subunit [Tundrisphaera lichenicola]|uniref:ABC transporter permease subunit n=1 Tax=Tundrisphaera lichenicola TaxID=2029860 RepID=UPI003EB905DF